MKPKLREGWCQSLTDLDVGEYKLLHYVGKGKIGYVYRAEHRKVVGSERAIKLTFGGLNQGWQTELRKVMALELIPGVVHFHDLGEETITHQGESHLCQYTIWDYIAPGENLGQYLRRNNHIQTSFLLAVVERILHVLNAVVEKGITRHGDLHSGNILVGSPTGASLDDSLQPRAPIFVSDFGYGVTGGKPAPKDDFDGLANIINEMVVKVDHVTATAAQRQILQSLRLELGKFLREQTGTERRRPIELLQLVLAIKGRAQASAATAHNEDEAVQALPSSTVGQFQVSEMLGDQWQWWRHLFVPTVPARSKILAVNIATVVTGPRGCGKTMLFRRLSERLVLTCGPVPDFPIAAEIVGLYVNANDFADAFAHFRESPQGEDEARLTCYANLCVLGEVLTVEATRIGLAKEKNQSVELLNEVQRLLVSPSTRLIEAEDQLENYRTALEKIKWDFPSGKKEKMFPGYGHLSQHRWLPHFAERLKQMCPWAAGRTIQIFVDDYSTPRVNKSMQRVLNRLFLQRSPHFVARIATEASTTFLPEDSSGKNLQDGDDFQLVDIGEEALFLSEEERLRFLREVFERRLSRDARVPSQNASLDGLLGQMPLSKTEFALRLRAVPSADLGPVRSGSQRRGRSRSRVNYYGENIFTSLWSGDTRTMIQLITDIVDDGSGTGATLVTPVKGEVQDRILRNRGGEWLDSHARNEPTDLKRVKELLKGLEKENKNFKLAGGGYGDHLKAVVEAFVAAARQLLLGPVFVIGTKRDVPRMAFRIEIVDEFRLDGLAREIYTDLIRYGLFLRDSRGKSVRGAFVPRLYLRRLLLPFCALALSKRDSVQLTCAEFTQLLLEPDSFRTTFSAKMGSRRPPDQIGLPFESEATETADPNYNDIDPEGELGLEEQEAP